MGQLRFRHVEKKPWRLSLVLRREQRRMWQYYCHLEVPEVCETKLLISPDGLQNWATVCWVIDSTHDPFAINKSCTNHPVTIDAGMNPGMNPAGFLWKLLNNTLFSKVRRISIQDQKACLEVWENLGNFEASGQV